MKTAIQIEDAFLKAMTFPEKVQHDVFKNPLPYGKTPEERLAYKAEEQKLMDQFWAEFGNYLLAEGVPPQYVKRVANAAWEDGHSLGFNEVLNSAYKFIGIFQP